MQTPTDIYDLLFPSELEAIHQVSSIKQQVSSMLQPAASIWHQATKK